jgi:hypothetical protein
MLFSACKQNLSSQLFDLDIENPLGGGTLAKNESSLYGHLLRSPDPRAGAFLRRPDNTSFSREKQFSFFGIRGKTEAAQRQVLLSAGVLLVWDFIRWDFLYFWLAIQNTANRQVRNLF